MQAKGFRRLGTMLDCSRGAVMTVEAIKKWIDIVSDLGYNTLMLYAEDTYEVDGHPYFGYLRGRYSKNEIKEIDGYAVAKGIELIPCIQTLAHLEAIFRWRQYGEMNDCNDILLTNDEKTYQLIDSMFATLNQCFQSKIVNIGMDEAFMLGRGRYQDKNGYQERFDILLNHLNEVSKIAKKYGFELIMWGDMFFRLLGSDYSNSTDHMPSEEITALIPDNVNLIYWDYYSKDYNNYDGRIKAHSAVKENIWFAGGLWSWIGFAPHNQFSIDATRAAFQACRDNDVRDVFLTMWGDDGAECSKFSLLPSLYFASEFAKGNFDDESIKKGFGEKYGIAFDDFMLLDLPGTPNVSGEFIVNPDSYMLYNDCLLGVFDTTVSSDDAQKYHCCAEKLKRMEDNADFGYLFRTLKNLCNVMAVKYELGVKTRAAYKAGDKKELENLLKEYDLLLERLDPFYEAFRSQWFTENKPNGFEAHDIRIGGLIQRVKHSRYRIRAFIDGMIPEIGELEENLLDAEGNGSDYKREPTLLKSWKLSAFIDVF